MEDDNVHDAENPVLVCLVTDVVDDDNDINNFYVGGDFDGDGDSDGDRPETLVKSASYASAAYSVRHLW